MLSILHILSMIIFVVQFIIGILGNGFIALINGINWVRNRKISLMDFILTCLASSRICFLCSALLADSFNLTSEKIVSSKTLLMSVVTICSGSYYFCTAFTTCLTLFYFFKIANFSNPTFLWMKQRMHMVFLMVVLATVLSCCANIIFTDAFVNISTQIYIQMEQNFTFNYMKSFYTCLPYLFLINLAFIIFFVVSLISFLLLLFSLWRHTKRMKRQGMYSRDSSTEAHVRAMKAMISSLILFIMHYFGNITILLAYSPLHSVIVKSFAHMLIFLYPSGHPFLLIFWNNKLKQAFLFVMKKLRCIREEIMSHTFELP